MRFAPDGLDAFVSASDDIGRIIGHVMAVSESYLSFILEQLDGMRGILTKRMFGGVGIYCDGTFFAVVDNDTLFFKVDTPLAERYRRLGMPPFAPIPGKPAMLGYYQVPADVLEDATLLRRWAAESVAAAAATPARLRSRRARAR